MADDRSVLREIAQLAADLGPALIPVRQAELLRSVADGARQLFEAKACSIALLDEERNELVFQVAAGGAEEEIVGMRVPVGRGIAGWAVASGQAIAVEDVSQDPRFARDVAEAVGYVPTSILAMPLETERDVLGVIEVLDRRPQPRDLEVLAILARQAALAIESCAVFSDLGRALFEAAAASAEGAILVDALEEVARTAPAPRAELAQLAAHLAELGRASPEARATATQLIGDLLAYVRAREEVG